MSNTHHNARDHYDGEGGLAALEACLSLPHHDGIDARIAALVGEVERRVTRWESQLANELITDHEAISKLFSVTENVSMSAYVNAGRLPEVWWAKLGVALERNGLYDRLTTQIHRETHANFARHSTRAMADSLAGPKKVGPKSEAALLAAAWTAATEVGMFLDAMEKLDDSGLRANSRKILGWHETLVESFTFSPPQGLGHEPAVLEFREWMRVRTMPFMEEWRRILDSIPNRGAERLLALADRVNRVMVAAHFVSNSTTASANARWARLEPVKTWIIAQRGVGAQESQAAFIRRILPQVRTMAREAGEPLSGDDMAVTRTVAGWLRKAKTS